jgi:hypothetical protein
MKATLTRDAAVTTPTPRATRGGSFTAPILTQLVSLHKHYKHRVQAKMNSSLELIELVGY